MPTSSRPRRAYETVDVVAALARQIRALSARVADADPEDLAHMVTLRDTLEAAIADAVHGQRRTHGRSWADLGRALGVTRQAMEKRYGNRA